MLGKNKIKLLRSLQQKKYRKKYNLFYVEGIKNTREILKSGWEVMEIIGTPQLLQQVENIKKGITNSTITPGEYKKISGLKTPPDIMVVCKIPELAVDPGAIENSLNLVLDSVTDPGNLGTIIRTAHWFGIQNIICSLSCVDVFNPKVVQSAMGSITHINIIYTNLIPFLEKQKSKGHAIYGAFLKGTSLYQTQLSKKGFLVLGNESNGISSDVEETITQKLHIPQFTNSTDNMDSLNVSIACAVFCSEFSRR